jgi:hypothetical protein
MDAEDLRRILALLADYGRTLDQNLWAEHMQLYADDARLLVFGKEYVGREQIEQFMRKTHRGHHLTGVPSIEFDGDRARAHSDYIFFRENLLYSAGSYADEFARGLGGWRLATRKIDIRFRATE